MMTEQERKDKKRAYDKAWNDKNKDKTKAYNKTQYNKNKDSEDYKEKYRASNKAWRNKNKHTEDYKEKNKARTKAWGLANPDKYKAYRLDYCIVYCIPNYDGLGSNYAGVTSNPTNRMYNHKSIGKFNTEEYIELDRADTRAEAEELEAEYHARGYDGAGGWELKK